MKIVGIEGLSPETLDRELENGGRFVIYTYAVSILVLSFKRPSNIIFVRGGQSRAVKGLPYTLISLLLGWWGVPWGPIFTLGALFGNLVGKDVTEAVLADLDRDTRRREAKSRRAANPLVVKEDAPVPAAAAT